MGSPKVITLFLIAVLVFTSYLAVPVEAGSSVAVTVRDSEGNVTPSAIVLLFNEGYDLVTSSRTDSEGVASFGDLTAGTYVLEVYHEGSEYMQPEFWGALTLISTGQSHHEILFTKHTPRIDYFDVSSSSVGPKEKLKVTVAVTNPEPFPLDVTVILTLDRDEYPPYDVEMSKDASVDEGSSKVFNFKLKPQGPGAHFVRVLLLAEYGEATITDQIPWTEAFTASGEIYVSVKDHYGQAVEDALLVLFDDEYIPRNEVYRTKRDGSASWNPIFPVYIIEVYYLPLGSLGFVEFWHAQQLKVSDGPEITLSKSSPSLSYIGSEQDKIKLGESATLSAEVLNPYNVEEKTRVTVILDRDRSLPFDYVLISDTVAVPGQSSSSYLLELSHPELGRYYSYAVVQAEFNGKFVVTDQESWQLVLQVTD